MENLVSGHHISINSTISKKIKMESFFYEMILFTLVHIIDHSNAIYLPKLSRINRVKKIVTCHDLIAIRTAREILLKLPKPLNRASVCKIGYQLSSSCGFLCMRLETDIEDLNRLIPLSKEKSSILIHLGTEAGLSTKSTKNPFQRPSF